MKSRWWDNYAKCYDAMWDSPCTSQLAGYLAGILNTEKAMRVFELGCGTGLATQHIAAAGIDVAGVDNCPGMLGIARKRCPDAVLAEADVGSLNFGQIPVFDAIVSFNMVHVCSDVGNVMDRIIQKVAEDRAFGILTWPADRLTLWGMFRLDIKHGRPMGESMKAGLLRWWFGLSGAILGIRTNKSAAILRCFGSSAEKYGCVCDSKMIEGYQNILVFRGCGRRQENE